MTLSIQTDRSLIRSGASSTRYVLARITAPRAPERGVRRPVNVALVLDRSGSMAGERKFTLAREAVEEALRLLRPHDRFSLVVYDTAIDVLMPSTPATPDAIRRALDALDAVGPRGATDLGGGWLTGCEQVAEFADRELVSRCLLLTDGLANQGITDRDELARHARELRERGVTTSTFGVGADFDERLLRDMAHEGGGHFYFIEGAVQIPEMLTGELGEALEVTLPDVTLVVSLDNFRAVPGAAPATLNRFRQHWRREAGQLHIAVGDLVSGQVLDVVVKLTFPMDALASELSATFTLTAHGEPVAGVEARETWTYANHRKNDLQPRNRVVDRAVAGIYAARARADATEANRHGRLDDARRVLERTARRIESYAGDDPELRRLVRELGDQVPEYADVLMSPMALKSAFFEAELQMEARDRSGRARR